MKTKKPLPTSIHKGAKVFRGQPKAKTVGQLKKLLAKYPDSLKVSTGLGDGVQLVWFNIGKRDAWSAEHLGFMEYGEWD